MNEIAKIESMPDCRALAAELARQPEFFSIYRDEIPGNESQKPVLTDARFTGARCDDEAVNVRVGAMRLLGLSDRAIERECGVDRRTIPHCLKYLEDMRLLPAVKDRLAMRTGDLSERSALVLSVLLDRATTEVSADLAAMIKAVATAHGITVEKMQLLTGSPTEIISHVSGDKRAEIEAWAKEIHAVVDVEATPVDLESNRT